MESKKRHKVRASQRQKFKLRLIIIAGVSIAAFSFMLVIYFQFFNNDVTKAKTIENLTQDQLPVDFHITSPVIPTTDSVSASGNRYKIAQPLSKTPAEPVQ